MRGRPVDLGWLAVASTSTSRSEEKESVCGWG